MKKGRQEENVALISRTDEYSATPQQRWANAVTPALQRTPTVDLSISHEMRGPCTMMGEAPVPPHFFLLMGYFNSSDSLIRAGDDEDFSMRVTAVANPHPETRRSR
jgi:hypothetical protein